MALLRSHLRERGLLQSEEMHKLPHGSTARVAGLVTCRQRPDTASGVVFVTVMAVVLAPVFHRFLHKFHLEVDDPKR